MMMPGGRADTAAPRFLVVSEEKLSPADADLIRERVKSWIAGISSVLILGAGAHLFERAEDGTWSHVCH